MFVLVWRVVATRYYEGAGPKPLYRNLVFNLCKQLWPLLVPSVLVQGTGFVDNSDICFNILAVSIATVIVQAVPASTLFGAHFLYQWTELEFKMSLAFGLVQAMNAVHNPKVLDGDLVAGIFFVGLFVPHIRLMWMFLEDMWYQDMGALNRHIVPVFYLPVHLGAASLYWLQRDWLQAPLHVLSFKGASVTTMLATQLHRPKLHGYQLLSPSNPEHLPLFNVVNFVFGVFSIYASVRVLSLKRQSEFSKK